MARTSGRVVIIAIVLVIVLAAASSAVLLLYSASTTSSTSSSTISSGGGTSATSAMTSVTSSTTSTTPNYVTTVVATDQNGNALSVPVSINGKYAGNSPVSQTLLAGSYTISCAAIPGYSSTKTDFTVIGAQYNLVTCEYTLSPSTVTSTTASGGVTLNVNAQLCTPLCGPYGGASIVVYQGGYSSSVKVATGTTNSQGQWSTVVPINDGLLTVDWVNPSNDIVGQSQVTIGTLSPANTIIIGDASALSVTGTQAPNITSPQVIAVIAVIVIVVGSIVFFSFVSGRRRGGGH